MRFRLGVVLVILSATGFAAKGILAKLVYQQGLNASTVLSLRMLSVLPIYLAGIIWFGRSAHSSRPGPRDLDFWKVVLLGLLGFDLSAIFDFEGLMKIGASLERLVLFLYPTFVVFLSAILHQRQIALREILSALMAYGGLAVVTGGRFGGGTEEETGIILVLVSGVFYAVYLVGVEQMVNRVNPLYLTSVVMVTATGAILLQSLLSGSLQLKLVDGHALFLIGAMGVFSTAIPTFLMTLGISMIGASLSSLLSFSGPVITLFMASAFLGEQMTFREGAGAVLILAGVGLVALKKYEKQS